MSVELTHRGDRKGHLLIKAAGEDTDTSGPRGGRRYIAVHRLVAYANRLIDSPGDDLQIHHVDGIPIRNGWENLIPLEPEIHGEVTREQIEARKEGDPPPKWIIDTLPFDVDNYQNPSKV